MHFCRQSHIFHQRIVVFSCALIFIFLFNSITPPSVWAATDYYRIVVLGDPHLPYKPAFWDKSTRQNKVMAAKEQLLTHLNAWNDIDLVVAVGDIAGGFGLDKEYEYAQDYFARLRHPYMAVTGNHDYIYADHWSPGFHWPWGDEKNRQKKLERFRSVFGLTELFQSRRAGPCLLIFLSADMISGNQYQTQISDRQLNWLRGELAANPGIPTIIFNHAPLKGTLSDEFPRANASQQIAQPHAIMRDIILHHPQIFLWVSGHLHVPATNENFNSPINLFEKQVLNIHNTDLDRENQWTNSLYIYADRVVIRTYAHKQKTWLPTLDRVVFFPAHLKPLTD